MKQSMVRKFGKKEGFGVSGSSLEQIAIAAAELYGSKHIKINFPYHGFNCQGTANRVAKEVSGLMPFAKKRLSEDDMTTMFYEEKQICGRGYYLPFQSECDVFFVESVKSGKVVEINLIKAPTWREYL